MPGESEERKEAGIKASATGATQTRRLKPVPREKPTPAPNPPAGPVRMGEERFPVGSRLIIQGMPETGKRTGAEEPKRTPPGTAPFLEILIRSHASWSGGLGLCQRESEERATRRIPVSSRPEWGGLCGTAWRDRGENSELGEVGVYA